MLRNKRNRILVLTLVMFTIIAPSTALADSTTNEAINAMSMSFAGTGNSTMVNIVLTFNGPASNDNAIVVEFWIDEMTDSHKLGETTAGTCEYETVWDITQWAEGYHVLIAEIKTTSLEITHDNKADNRLDLPFCTQDWFLAPVGNVYGYIQYEVDRLLRQQAEGYLSMLTIMPLWAWIIVLILIIVVIVGIHRLRKKGKQMRQYAGRPYHYVANRYNDYNRRRFGY